MKHIKYYDVLYISPKLSIISSLHMDSISCSRLTLNLKIYSESFVTLEGTGETTWNVLKAEVFSVHFLRRT